MMEKKTNPSPFKRKAIDAVAKREETKLKSTPFKEYSDNNLETIRILHSSTRVQSNAKRFKHKQDAMLAVANIFNVRHGK